MTKRRRMSKRRGFEHPSATMQGAMSASEARTIAAHYGDRTGEGSGALRYFARTGKIGQGLRAYLSGDPANMPPQLAQLTRYVVTN